MTPTMEHATLSRGELLPQLQSALDFAAGQARRVIEMHPGYYPMYTVGGKWKQEPEHWTHWCEGFYPGIFWLLHKQTGDAWWRQKAEEYSRKLEPRKNDRNVHDLGFLFLSTYLRWYRLTHDRALKEVLIQAGRTLALRRQPGGYLASFIGPQSLFIDIMMNVGLVLWAANAAGDGDLQHVGIEHCQTTARYLVRRDGGTAHEGTFDQHGRFLRQTTHQGWRPESTWSRGLAWAIYGFTAVYRLCEDSQFLEIARRCADFYLKRTPPDLVPYWDYDVPEGGPRLKESSAAAIAASGFWDLSEAVGETSDQDRYRQAALGILHALCTDDYLARQRPGWEGILMHGVYHFHKNLGVDESVAWGDHFFVEALVKAIAGKAEAAW